MSETEQEMISCALSFLAENVNLYNWHLLRSPNPNRYMYDETEDSMHKLYYKLFERAEENNEISIKLKNAVLKLCLTDDEEEDNNSCARLLAIFVQNRQREIHHHNRHPESERGLWLLYYTNDYLYSKLNKLEKIYIDILCHDDTELRKISYNHIVEAEDNLPQYRIGPPELGESNLELELETIYLSDHMGYEEDIDRDRDRDLRDYEEDLRYYEEMDRDRERYYEEMDREIDRDIRDYEEELSNGEYDEYQENTPPALKIVDTNIIMEFDCPICFEEQTSGNQCATTTCEHQYCAPCFESMTKHKAVCAMCRGKISEYIVSIVV